MSLGRFFLSFFVVFFHFIYHRCIFFICVIKLIKFIKINIQVSYLF